MMTNLCIAGSNLPHYIPMFPVPWRGLVHRAGGLELEVVHRHVAVMEAGDHHVRVLGADVHTHHAAAGPAGELGVRGVL